MGKISKIVSIAMGLMLFVAINSCSDDFLLEGSGANGVDMDRIVEVELPFNLGKGITSHIVTRSTDQTGKDSQLSGIMVFVYENKGGDPSQDKRLAYHLFESPSASLEGSTGGWIPDPNDATCGYLKLYLPAGDVYIYLIGNATGSFIDFFPDLGDSKLENRQDFLDRVRPKWNGNMFTVDGYLPLVGKVNNSTGACHIGVDASGKSIISYKKDGEPDKDYFISQVQGNHVEDNSFILKRLMCKVSMEFKCPEGVKFKPLTYKFYHCSEYVPPTEESWVWQKLLNTVDTQTMTFDSQAPNSFTVYLPENIRDYDPAIGGKTQLDFTDRDLVAKNASGENELEGDKAQPGHANHYKFQYAPEKSTYVEITGKFDDEKNGISADTKYILHLGDFSKGDFNEFSLKRDYHYKYTVTVNGVNDIIVEVTGDGSEVNPSASGIVFEGGARQLLDAHYEQVEMKFVREQVDKGVYIFAQTPYGNLNCKYLPLEKKLDETYTNSPNTIDDAKKLLKWVEFKKQENKGSLALYDSGVKNIFDALDEVCQGSGESYYTCFVDEYFYTANPLTGAYAKLEDFVNADGRLFSIGSNLLFSKDKESVVVQSVYTLKQRSISTFYDPADGRNKFGVETIDEIGPMKYGNPNANNTTDFKHGRSLTMAEIGSDRSIDFTKVGWILNESGTAFVKAKGAITGDNAYRAVLARNRDLNGNGRIDDDEFRWYTPSRDQALGLWIGEPALPAEAALFPESTEGISRAPNGAVWPVFTSNGGRNRVVWAEEGCSFGDVNGQGDGGYLYAVRNLGNNANISGGGYHIDADPYYSYDSNTRVITLFLANNALRAFSNRELAVHNEQSPVNRPFRSFQVANHPVMVQATATCDSWLHSGSDTYTYKKALVDTRYNAANALRSISGEYAGDGETAVGGGAAWRLPNQRELAIMLVAIGNDLGYNDGEYRVSGARCNAGIGPHNWVHDNNAPAFLMTRTTFSVKGYQPNGSDASYCFDADNDIIQLDDVGSSTNSKTARALCVRDAQ